MAGPIRISILANAAQAKRELQSTATTAERIGGGFRKMALPAVAALGAIAGIGKEALDSVQRIERINAQTATVIKSTGSAAGVTASHVEGLAGNLENLTATEAEATQEGANLLLTFTNIKNGVGPANQIFDRTTVALVDMARAMGTDPQSAAIQLGKALNDPIKGVGALSRVGVSFTEDQKNLIKTLVESGDVMGAQKVILGELEKQFGGSGAAFAKTTEGQVELAKHAFGTLTEELVVGLLPTLQSLAQTGTKAFEWATEHSGTVKTVVVVLAGLSAAVLAVNAVMAVSGAAVAIYNGAMLAFRGVTIIAANAQLALNLALLANPVGLVIAAIVALVAIFVLAWKKSETFRSIVTGAWNAIKTASVAVWEAVKAVVVGAFNVMRTIITTYIKVYVTVIRAAWTAIKGVTSAVWNAVKGVVTGVVRAVVAVVRGGFNTAKTVASAVWNAVKSGTTAAWNGIKTAVRNAITGVVGFLRGMKDRVTGVFSAAGRWLLGAGKAILQGLIDGIQAMIGRVQSTLGRVTNLIPDWKGPARRDARLLRPAGELIIGGLIDGFDAQTPKVKKTLEALSRDISTFSASPTATVALDARAAWESRAAGSQRSVEVRFTAEQVSQLQRGRAIKADLAAYESVGKR